MRTIEQKKNADRRNENFITKEHRKIQQKRVEEQRKS